MLDAPHVVENAHYDTVTDLVLAPEIKSLITCGNDFKVKTWDAFRLAATRTFNIPQSSLMRVTYLDQAKAVVVCSFMNDVLLLSVEDGSLVNSLVGHKDCVDAVWFSKDTDSIITAGLDNIVHIWSAESCTLLRSIDSIKRAVVSFTVVPSEDGNEFIIAADKERNLKVWDSTSLELMTTIPKAHAEPINAVIADPYAAMVVTAGEDGLLKIWRVD
eukprot:TRINITY_DN1713_c0_g1_i1.p1 TRINITY_DN1713_c0_g1~~TRINITY_DN1713_c0_g1_i1.p1  ORF type:complete len:216 (-),score=48.02 TRINITY_DN1713_c0_g1_i1:91-738(-)